MRYVRPVHLVDILDLDTNRGVLGEVLTASPCLGPEQDMDTGANRDCGDDVNLNGSSDNVLFLERLEDSSNHDKGEQDESHIFF